MESDKKDQHQHDKKEHHDDKKETHEHAEKGGEETGEAGGDPNKISKSQQKKLEKEAKKAGAKEEEKPKKTDISKLSTEKQWAYFGEDENLLTSDEDKKLKETITPVSLFVIRDKIIKLLRAVQEFQDKKAKAPRKPKPEIPSLS